MTIHTSHESRFVMTAGSWRYTACCSASWCHLLPKLCTRGATCSHTILPS